MGGIETDGKCATRLAGLYAAGECASVGLHGANRLGSNSLSEIVVFGKVAGEQAAEFAATQQHGNTQALVAKAEALIKQHLSLLDIDGTENPAISATNWACPWKPVSVSTVPKS
jgi:fumarate reductase flavoprotein subunit